MRTQQWNALTSSSRSAFKSVVGLHSSLNYQCGLELCNIQTHIFKTAIIFQQDYLTQSVSYIFQPAFLFICKHSSCVFTLSLPLQTWNLSNVLYHRESRNFQFYLQIATFSARVKNVGFFTHLSGTQCQSFGKFLLK